MGRRYAEGTEVSVYDSRAEIEKVLNRYGADNFAYANDSQKAVIMFEAKGWRVRFVLPLPPKDDFKYTEERRLLRSEDALEKVYDQEIRRRWRALKLAILSRLESVESGIETFEQAFLSHIVLPSGQTASQWMVPQLEQAYKSNQMPPMLMFEAPQNGSGIIEGEIE